MFCGDESKTFLGVEPFYCTLCTHDCCLSLLLLLIEEVVLNSGREVVNSTACT